MDKKLQIITEFPYGRTPSCKECIFGHDGFSSSGCGLVHKIYINGVLKGDDPDKTGNDPLLLCNIYDFSKPNVKLITEYDKIIK